MSLISEAGASIGKKPEVTKEPTMDEKLKMWIAEADKKIAEAVKAGIKAGLEKAKKDEQAKFDAYRSTEERLYALPTLIEKVKKDTERLQDLEQYPELPRRSKDIILGPFNKSGIRLSESEIVGALKQDIEAHTAADQREIDTLHTALALVRDDKHYRALEGRYFEGKHDKELAAELGCDTTTIYRSRSRMVKKIAVRLYGVDALRRKEE